MTKNKKTVPVRKRLIAESNCIVTRSIPSPSNIKVKVGDKIDVATTIAEIETSLGSRQIKLAQELGVKKQDIEKYIKREIGKRIYKGEILAQKKGSLGFGKKVFTSPIDGIVKEIDKEEGLATIDHLPSFAKISAFIPGEVIEIKEREIRIKSAVTQVFGVLGIGNERTGFIKVVSKPDDFLLPHHLDSSCQEAIVVGGAITSRSTIEKAVAIGVSAIVTGGIHIKDFESFKEKNKFISTIPKPNTGLTVIVTEGYGRIPMGDDVWTTLFLLNGKLATVSGEEKKIIIPIDEAKNEEPDIPENKELEKGDKVRILADPDIGSIGMVIDCGDKEETLPSGIKTHIITVKVDKEEKKVPFQNLEIIV